MSSSLTIITRTSPLALWQAEYIQRQLQHFHPSLKVQIQGVKTQGDRWLETPLYKIGGKSLFVKELEIALLEGKADIAVHSLKDMPVNLPEGLQLGAIGERENPFDAWVCPSGHTLATLPAGSVVGTSSLRRQVQLKALRPDLQTIALRGNVGSRLEKCLAKECDAIVLAVAGLLRLNLERYITSIFDETQMIPAVAQGALGIECRADDHATLEWLKPLHHAPTETCMIAERAMNRALGGSCHVPVAGYAKWEGNMLRLTGRVGDLSTYAILEATQEQTLGNDPERLGNEVAQALIAKGAMEFIQRSVNWVQ
jgi:hydroxymethylbilane synthase